MNQCNQMREELLAVAAGRDAGADLELHLERCPACAAALAQWRARSLQLDAGIRQALAAEPPPFLAERILARIRSRGAASLWPARWKPVCATLVLAATAMAFTYYRRAGVARHQQEEPVRVTAVALARWHSPTENLLVMAQSRAWMRAPLLGDTFFAIRPASAAAKQEAQKR